MNGNGVDLDKGKKNGKNNHNSKVNSHGEASWENKVLKNLEIISSAKVWKKKQEINKEQWKVAGATLDRLCIVLFLMTIIATLCFVFMTAPRITL